MTVDRERERERERERRVGSIYTVCQTSLNVIVVPVQL